MQRQQLQQAVQHMETALEDPQQVLLSLPVLCRHLAAQGAANVAIYKQYWDQYGGQLERLRAEQPMMHHLLQVTRETASSHRSHNDSFVTEAFTALHCTAPSSTSGPTGGTSSPPSRRSPGSRRTGRWEPASNASN
jgi:hypothetical protein